VAGKKRKGASDFAIDLGRAAARKRGELLEVQKRLVNPLGTGLEIFFLMDLSGGDECFRFCRLICCFLSVSLGAGYRQTTTPDGTTDNHLSSRMGIRKRCGIQRAAKFSRRCQHGHPPRAGTLFGVTDVPRGAYSGAI